MRAQLLVSINIIFLTLVTCATLDQGGGFGTPCTGGRSREGSCGANANLVCRDGICSCPPAQIWDRLAEGCRMAAERPLMANANELEATPAAPECVRNSNLEPVPGNGDKQWCKCASGYNVSAGGLCHASNRGKCVFLEDCAAGLGLHCVEGVCTCGDYGHPGHYWDAHAGNGTCLAAVGAPCGEKVNTTAACVATSHCDPVEGICTCDGGEGFEATRDQHGCYKPLDRGAPCRPGQCSHTKRLRCIDEVCTCGSSMAYDESEGRCAYKSSKQCGKTGRQGASKAADAGPEYYFMPCDDETEAVHKMRYGSKEWRSFCVKATNVRVKEKPSPKNTARSFWD